METADSNEPLLLGDPVQQLQQVLGPKTASDTIFWERKLQNHLFFNFFNTFAFNFRSKMNDDFNEASFKVYVLSFCEEKIGDFITFI